MPKIHLVEKNEATAHFYKGNSAIFRNGLRRKGSEKEVTFSANSFEELFRAILRWYKVDRDEIEIEVENFASDRPGKVIDATAVMQWLNAAGQDQGRVIAALKGPGLNWKITEDTWAN